MKIIDTTGCDTLYTEEEIKNFVQCSNPKPKTAFEVLKIKFEAGWVYITVKNNEKEFSINYSDVMVDTSDVIKFFAQITNLKEDIACILNYEGSAPLIFIQPLENNIRFLFAHDYKLFMNDNVDDYELNDYTIKCDIIVDKKYFLGEFYKVFLIYTNGNSAYNPKSPNIEYNPKLGEKYLAKIRNYLKKP